MYFKKKGTRYEEFFKFELCYQSNCQFKGTNVVSYSQTMEGMKLITTDGKMTFPHDTKKGGPFTADENVVVTCKTSEWYNQKTAKTLKKDNFGREFY